MKKATNTFAANLKVRASMEWLWLLAIVLVPLTIVPPNSIVTGFIQVPKVFIFRTIVLILLTLVVWDWALIKQKNPQNVFKIPSFSNLVS